MEGTLFLALGEGLVIEQVVQEPQRFVVTVRSTTPTSSCPLCETLSDFIHSHYQRRLADVPCGGRAIQIQLIVRRLSCRNRVCHRAVFTERLPGLARPWAQMTQRLREALCKLGFATCAEAVARLAPQLGMKGPASTVLRCQRATLLVAPEPFTKIGLDDFAFRRGRTYGTIIVNLETHRVIDVLPNREVATVAAWLQVHPEIKVISRDRGLEYIQASSEGRLKRSK